MPPAAPLTGMAAAAAAAAQRACVPPHAAPSQAPRAGAATSLVLFELWARGRAQRAPASIPSFLHGARVQRARTLLPPLAPLCEETGLHRSKPLPRAPPARHMPRPNSAAAPPSPSPLHSNPHPASCASAARRTSHIRMHPRRPPPLLSTKSPHPTAPPIGHPGVQRWDRGSARRPLPCVPPPRHRPLPSSATGRCSARNTARPAPAGQSLLPGPTNCCGCSVSWPVSTKARSYLPKAALRCISAFPSPKRAGRRCRPSRRPGPAAPRSQACRGSSPPRGPPVPLVSSAPPSPQRAPPHEALRASWPEACKRSASWPLYMCAPSPPRISAPPARDPCCAPPGPH